MTRVLAFVLLVLLATLAFASCFRLSSAAAETVPGCYVVRLKPGAVATASAEPLGLNWYRVYADSQAKAEADYWGKTDAPVEPCYVMRSQDEPAPSATVNDPMLPQLWGLARVNTLSAWDASKGEGRVVVVVFDTGLTPDHPDLVGKWYGGKSFVSSPSDWRDGHGHGTHVAGTIAAFTNNRVGVAGVGYNVRVSVAQVLGANGSGDTANIARAINEATAAIPPGWVAVYNFSLGCECPPPQVLADAIANAYRRGVVIVAALGNNNADTRLRRFYPAAFDEVISVSATDERDSKAVFSNWGAPDISAPGTNILSTYPPNTYKSLSGTSMAAPHVSAVAALVRAIRPTWGPSQVRQALLATARQPNGYTPLWHGAGVLDAGKAVRYNGGVLPPPTQPPRLTPVPTPTPAVGGEWGAQLERLINGYRREQGLAALRHDDRLARAADFHNRYQDESGCFSHQCPGEPDPFQRMRNAGYPLQSGSEVIGRGYQNPQHMLQGWQQSAPHSSILLSTAFVDIGCAFLDGANGHYRGLFWTCALARPLSAGGAFDLLRLPGPLGVTP